MMKINMKGFDKTRTFTFLLCLVAWVISNYFWPHSQLSLPDNALGAFIGLFMHWWMNSKNRLSS